MVTIMFILKGFHDSKKISMTFARGVFSDNQCEDAKENRISCIMFLLEESSTGIGKGELLIYLAGICNGKLPRLFIYLAASNISNIKFLSTFILS